MDVIIDSYSSTSPSVIVENAPLNFVRGGIYLSLKGETYMLGTGQSFWSSTVDSSANANDFYFYYLDFCPINKDPKGYGFSVRCVVQKLSFFNQPNCNSRECTIELCEKWILPFV